MDISKALDSFAALAQETRLNAFRLLVREEPKGLAAGEIARRLAVPHNTLSIHLGVLSQAGWLRSERQGRSIIYRANLAHMNATIQFLVHDCCGGHPEICAPMPTAGQVCCNDTPPSAPKPTHE